MEKSKEHKAVVLFPKEHGAFDKIYGLTVLERTFHALERGGAGIIFLPESVKGSEVETLVNKPGWKVSFQFVEKMKNLPVDGQTGLLVLSRPLVLDPQVSQVFFEKKPTGPQVLISKNREIAFFPPPAISQIKAVGLSLDDSFQNWLDALNQQGAAMREMDFPGLICEAVRSPEEKKAVKKALIRNLTKPSDGWVSRHLNRPISTQISRVLAYTPITPNQFTIVTGLAGLATGVFAAMGGYWNFLAAGTLFHLTSILDGVDGELARLKFKSSPFGQWLDTVVDNLSYVAGLAGIIIGIYRTGATDAVKIAAGLAVVFVVLALGSLYLYLLRFKSGGTLLNVKYSFQDGDGWFDKVMQVAAAFGKRDLFALIFFMLAIAGQLPMAVGYVAIMAFFVFAFSVQAHVKAARERSIASSGQ